MKILVTTHPRNADILPDFDLLFQRFWGGEYELIGVERDVGYSNALREKLDSIKDDRVIILCDDFYFIEPVDKSVLDKLIEFATHTNADRVSLQSIDDGYIGFTKLETTVAGLKMYRIHEKHQYVCSFEASIWKREFLLKVLIPNENPWEAEVNSGFRARGHNVVFVPEKRVVQYRDAMIHGQPRIKVIDGEFHNLVPGGTVEGIWENLHIKR